MGSRMKVLAVVLAPILAGMWVGLVGAVGAVEAAAKYDLVLTGGRVMDPESGLDAVRNVALSGNRIAAISADALPARRTLDVSGLVVAPGFIDTHAHAQNNKGNLYQSMDGVTTALDLEGGRLTVGEYYRSRDGRALLNYGVSVSHHGVRKLVKHGVVTGWDKITRLVSEAKLAILKADAWAYQPATPEELDRITALFAEKFAEGGIGVGMALEYTPGVGYPEVFRIFETAALHHLPVTVHVRRHRGARLARGINVSAVQEVLANAAATGAALHIVHITSSSLDHTAVSIAMIESARRNGVQVTTEVYPYTAGSTNLGSAAFDDGWRDRLGISYGDLQWTATGERLTQETFEVYRRASAAKGGADVIAYFIPPDAMKFAVAHPQVAIASDGLNWVTGGEHPRGAGAFARVLGRHVREQGDLDLMTALAKMTLLPARRLAPFVPIMERKGRIKVGGDADLTIFDPQTVIDNATFESPMTFPSGILHVLVNGSFVVKNGRPVEDVFPGQAIKYVPGNRED